MNFLQSNPFSPERAKQIKQRNERERERSTDLNNLSSRDPLLPSTATDKGRRSGNNEHNYDSEDAANLSPWQGIGSPSSSSSTSEFESIRPLQVHPYSKQPPSDSSDIEIVLDSTPQRTSSLSASEYARSMSRRGRDRSLSVEEEEQLGRGVEGDDEDSSAFEDAGDDGRGRGRTRERRRDPELKRSMLEDALRSSLSTILSLAPAHTGMSQTPQMSQVSLANLLSAPRSAFSSAPPLPSHISASTSSRPNFPPSHRPSPFASSLAARFEEEDEDEDEVEFLSPSNVRTPQEVENDDVFTTSSEDEEDEEDNQTELSPCNHASNFSRAIPIPSSSSRSTRPSRSNYYYSRDDAYFSPLQPSRPLGVSATAAGGGGGGGGPRSDSPPSSYSRRRGARRGGSGRGITRGRGMGSSLTTTTAGGGGSSVSPQPGPASLEERRRARMLAAQSGWTQGERAGATDVEDETVQPDEAFAELLSAARFFSDLSPRASHTRSLPNSFDSTRTARASLPPPARQSASTPILTRGYRQRPPEEEEEEEEEMDEEEEEDPALASESVPTLGGLSSGAEESKSPNSRDSPDPRKKEDLAGTSPTTDNVSAEEDEQQKKKKKRSWLNWLGIGKTVELKVWHLVGLCGVLVGVGWGASTLIRSYVLPHASSIVNTSSSVSVSSNYTSGRLEFVPLSRIESTPQSTSSMSSLFL